MSSMLEMITQQLGTNGLRQMSSQLGSDEASTGKAIAAALPMLLGGLARNAEKGDGAGALASALDRDHDGSVLNDVAGFLGGGGSSAGAGILRHVFGSRQKNVESGVSKSSGMSAGSAASLLTMLAPLVMGQLGKQKREKNLDAQGLAGLLGSERQAVERQAPKEMSILNQFLDSDSDGDVDVSDIASKGLGMLGKLMGGR